MNASDVHVWLKGGGAMAVSLQTALAAEGLTVRDLGDGVVPISGLGLIIAEDDTEVDALLRAQQSGRAVVVVPDRVHPGRAWTWMQAGATDVVSCIDPPSVARSIRSRIERWNVIDRWIDAPVVRRHLVGESRAWRHALRRVIEAALYARGPILIRGETGTGKELVARLIHTIDERQDKGQLVVLDCTTVVPDLSGSEFFGHEKGAFTNAVATREGAFELAHNGTLFLDEVGDLPLGLQAELLRVVQEKKFKRVGSHTWRDTHFRLVCATHRRLRDMIERKVFRQDLYHRIAGWTVRLPPLRERRSDIVRLAHRFLEELHPGDPPRLDPTVEDLLTARDYPGNVRELRQLVRRIGARHSAGGIITIGDLPDEEDTGVTDGVGLASTAFRESVRQAVALGVGLKEIARIAGDVAVDVALRDTGGNVKLAADRLDVSRRTIQMRRPKDEEPTGS